MSISPTERENADCERESVACVLIFAPMLTLGLAVASVIGFITLVPRREIGGGRSVPEISWSAYGLLGNLVPFLISLVIVALFFRKPRHRILAWILAAHTCYIAHEIFVTNLLRRDFIGKF